MSIKNIFNNKSSLKKFVFPLAILAGLTGLISGCDTAATKASRNLSTAADNFEIQREVVFYNLINGHYFATIKGRCSIEVDAADDQLEVTCKHGPEDFRKHFLGRAANATYFVMQTEPANVSEYHTRITFNPQGFIPDIDFRGDAGELGNPTRPDTHNKPVPKEEEPIKRSEQPATKGTLPELGHQPG
jgi:hypothetical protein